MNEFTSNKFLLLAYTPLKLDKKVKEWLKIAEFKLRLVIDHRTIGNGSWPIFFNVNYSGTEFELYKFIRFERSLECLSELFRWLQTEIRALPQTPINASEVVATLTDELDNCLVLMEKILNFVRVLTDTLKSMDEVKLNPTSQRMLTYAYDSLPAPTDVRPIHSTTAVDLNFVRFKQILDRASQINTDSLKIQKIIEENRVIAKVPPVKNGPKPMYIKYASPLGIFREKNTVENNVEIDCVIFAEFITNFKQSLDAFVPLKESTDLDVKFYSFVKKRRFRHLQL